MDVVVVLPWVPPIGDVPLEAHDLGQHLGAAHDRHAALTRAASTSGLPSLMADEITTTPALAELSALWPMTIMNALGAQPLDIGAVLGVGAGDFVAEVLHHGGDAGHADAANADEMDGPGVERNGAADHEFPKRNVTPL